MAAEPIEALADPLCTKSPEKAGRKILRLWIHHLLCYVLLKPLVESKVQRETINIQKLCIYIYMILKLFFKKFKQKG